MFRPTRRLPAKQSVSSFVFENSFVVDSLSYETNVKLDVRNEFTIPVINFPFSHKWIRGITRALPSLAILLGEKLKILAIWLNDHHHNCTGHESILSAEDYDIILVEISSYYL